MAGSQPRGIFEAYLSAVNERDLDALDALLHPDFEDFYPQSGERTRGAANLRAIIEHYPGGGWTDEGRDRVVGGEDRWIATPMFTLLRDRRHGQYLHRCPEGALPGRHRVVRRDLIGEIRDGRLWRTQSFWAPTFEPPAWRAAWVEVGT